MHTNRKILYLDIANEVIENIKSGHFKAGDRLFSRRELMEKYNIGDMTAVKVQNLLADMNFVRKIQGKGIFINYASNSLPMILQSDRRETVKKIVDLRFAQKFSGERSYPNLFYKEMDRLIQSTQHPPYEIRWFSPTDISGDGANRFPVEPETGYLLFNRNSISSLFGANILLNSAVHSVVMDTIFPDTNCVLKDSFDGMGKLVEYAFAQGCRKFLYAKNFVKSVGSVYNEERKSGAVSHARRLGFECETVDSGSYTELAEYLSKRKTKTAVMFPQDEGAIVLKRLLGKNPHKHIVTGFDDLSEFEKPDPEIPTIKADVRKTAETAMEILCGKPSVLKQIVRIPGTLVNV